MRKIKYIVVHCSETPKGKYFDIDDIREWHVKGNGWSDVGYHYIILLDGTIQIGRDLKTVGAHVKGFNSKSIGICYIGGGLKSNEDTRTISQQESLTFLIATLKRTFREAVVMGHRDFKGVTKSCPAFDAKTIYSNI